MIKMNKNLERAIGIYFKISLSVVRERWFILSLIVLTTICSVLKVLNLKYMKQELCVIHLILSHDALDKYKVFDKHLDWIRLNWI
jgi:hypothetical protein